MTVFCLAVQICTSIINWQKSPCCYTSKSIIYKTLTIGRQKTKGVGPLRFLSVSPGSGLPAFHKYITKKTGRGYINGRIIYKTLTIGRQKTKGVGPLRFLSVSPGSGLPAFHKYMTKKTGRGYINGKIICKTQTARRGVCAFSRPGRSGWRLPFNYISKISPFQSKGIIHLNLG